MNPRIFWLLFASSTLFIAPLRGQETITPVPKAPAPPAEEEENKKAKPEPATPGAEVEKPKLVAKPAIKQKYVVQSGDNLWKIAKAHEIDFRALLHANDLTDADALKVGDVLSLPEDVKSKNPPPPEVEKTPGSPVTSTDGPKEEAPVEEGEWELYTIQSGDNPWKIAKVKGLDHQAIVNLNPGLDFTKLSVGQEIKIPKK